MKRSIDREYHGLGSKAFLAWLRQAKLSDSIHALCSGDELTFSCLLRGRWLKPFQKVGSKLLAMLPYVSRMFTTGVSAYVLGLDGLHKGL